MFVSLSPHSPPTPLKEAKGLKIGMHNPYMDGSKVTDQIFWYFAQKLRYWDIYKFKVLYW